MSARVISWPHAKTRGLLLALVCAFVPASTLLVAAPSAAVTPRVDVSLSSKSISAGDKLSVRVTVRKGLAGQKVSVQREAGSRWATVTSKSLPQRGETKKRVSLTFKPEAGRSYRVYLAKKGDAKSVAKPFRVTVLPAAQPTPTPLRFDLSNAAGLAISSSSFSARGRSMSERDRAGGSDVATGSNLQVVTESGTAREALTSGSANVDKFWIAPSGRVFVVFRGRVNLNDTSTYSPTGCLFAEIDSGSGVPSCIDASLDSVAWSEPLTGIWDVPPIQFDASGAVYYRGNVAGTAVLRRSHQGAVKDFANSNMTIRNWHVLPSGYIIIMGTTNSTGAWWTRLINPQGGLSTLLEGGAWGDLFPDGNFYFPLDCDGPGGLRRFDTTTLQFDAQFYLRGVPQPSAVVSARCDGPRSVYYDAMWGPRHTTSDGRVVSYRFINNGWKALEIARIYPTPPQPDGGGDYDPASSMGETVSDDGYHRESQVFSQAMTLAEPVGDRVLFAGTDHGLNKLVAFDLDEWRMDEIALPADLEFYHLEPTGPDTAMFDALRFSDNRVVLGRVDLLTNSIEILSTLPVKWDTFEGFSSGS